MSDIARILQKFNQLTENKKQLPALFKPKTISPVLGAKEKEHPTHNYFVGEEVEESKMSELDIEYQDWKSMMPMAFQNRYKISKDEWYAKYKNVLGEDSDEQGYGSEVGDTGADETPDGVSPQTKMFENDEPSPVERAVLHRIMMQHTSLLGKYGPAAVMNAVRDVADFVGDVDEIGSSDVSAWVKQVERDLSENLTESTVDKKSKAYEKGGADAYYHRTMNNPYDKGTPEHAEYAAGFKDYDDGPKGGKQWESVSEGQATEDKIADKKSLGDYLQDLATAVKKDPDLIDAVPTEIDKIGPAVKTIKTDDGHEIKIHGNEDDGFRVTIKSQPVKSKFESLDHAVMACEMYCNRRKMKEQLNTNNDYLEER